MTKTKSQQAQEYAEKKVQTLDKAVLRPFTDIKQAYLDGYTAAEQSMTDSEAPVIQGWVARDSNSDLFIYNYKPKRDTRWDSVEIWNGETYIELDSNLFPDLTWDSDPLEVEIILKRKNNGTTTSPKLQME